MATRRTMVWLLVFLLTLPTVMATADSAQRLAEDRWSIRTAHLKEGEVYRYDLHFSSKMHGIDTTVEDWMIVTVGQVDSFRFVDGVEAVALPVTIATRETPWQLESSEWSSREQSAATEFYDVTSGRLMGRTSDVQEQHVNHNGDAASVPYERVSMHQDHQTVGQRMGGSFFARGEFPHSLYMAQTPVSLAATLVTQIDGHIQAKGTIDGHDVYDVQGQSGRTVVYGRFSCHLNHPELQYVDYDTGPAADLGATHETRDQRTWVDPDLSLPRATTCHETYTSGADVIEDIRLALTLSHHEPGGDAVAIGWSHEHRDARPAAGFGTPEPLQVPGTLADGDAALRLPFQSVLDGLAREDHPDYLAFIDDADPPWGLAYAEYDAYRPVTQNSAPEAADDSLPIPIPIDPDTPANDASGPTTAFQVEWYLILENRGNEALSVRWQQNHTDDGTVLDSWVSYDDAQRYDTVPFAELTKARVPIGDLLAAYAGLADFDAGAWHDDPEAEVRFWSQFSVSGPRDDVEYRHWHSLEITRSHPDLTPKTEAGYARETMAFQVDDGSISWGGSTVYESESADEPQRGTFAPASAETQIVSTDYRPAAAAASGLAVLVGFGLAFFWDTVARTVGATILAPLYAKIRKEKVLDHRSRDEIVTYVEANPGARLGAIRAHLGAGYGTTIHHLRTLERNGLIASRKVGRERCFFLPGLMSPSDMDASAASTTAAAQRVLRLVEARPGMTQREIAEVLEVNSSSVRYQAKRLLEHGAIKAKRAGRTVRYYARAAEGPDRAPERAAGPRIAPERAPNA